MISLKMTEIMRFRRTPYIIKNINGKMYSILAISRNFKQSEFKFNRGIFGIISNTN